jgi:glycerol-3-phosphate O-acyltransferase / dihydroxyacetone phosphate acyltransferase
MIVNLKKAIIGYNKELMQLNIRDHQVSYARFTRFTALRMIIFRAFHLALLSVAVLPGLVMFAPVFITAKLISIQKSKEALAASSVKIAARDVIATWKILIALGMTPVLYCSYAGIALYIAEHNRLWGNLPEFMPPWTIFPLSAMFFAALSFLALRFGESALDIVKSLRPLVLALSPFHGHVLPKLRERRAALVLEVNRVINTLGPELFPDFAITRIIPQATPDDRFEDGRIEDHHFADTGVPDLSISEPSSPSSPTFNKYFDTSRVESYANLGSIGVFSSRPTTPRRARSRSNSFGGGAFGGMLGFSPIDADSEELSKSIRGAMRQRNTRRLSESERGSGAVSSRSSSPDSSPADLGGPLHMTKDTKEE